MTDEDLPSFVFHKSTNLFERRARYVISYAKSEDNMLRRRKIARSPLRSRRLLRLTMYTCGRLTSLTKLSRRHYRVSMGGPLCILVSRI